MLVSQTHPEDSAARMGNVCKFPANRSRAQGPGGLEPCSAVHFTLLQATRMRVQGWSSRRLICMTGCPWVVAWMISPSPMYMAVCVILSGPEPKNSRSPALQIFSLDHFHSVPGRLQIGVSRHVDASTADQHLGKAGAVVSISSIVRPTVRKSQEPLGQRDGLVDGQWFGIANHSRRAESMPSVRRADAPGASARYCRARHESSSCVSKGRVISGRC